VDSIKFTTRKFAYLLIVKMLAKNTIFQGRFKALFKFQLGNKVYPHGDVVSIWIGVKSHPWEFFFKNII